jgi:hypothetical protein
MSSLTRPDSATNLGFEIIESAYKLLVTWRPYPWVCSVQVLRVGIGLQSAWDRGVKNGEVKVYRNEERKEK